MRFDIIFSEVTDKDSLKTALKKIERFYGIIDV